VQANRAYIYLRGEFWDVAQALEQRLMEMEAAGFLGDSILGTGFSLHIHTHLGAGAYICGEETALLESLEGRLGQPRLRPPFPATCGLYGKPTVINNVETLTNVPLIVDRGSAWYRSNGTSRSPGTKIFCLSGRVNRPGNYELPFGTPLRKLIYDLGGGIPGGRKIKAILPAGASSKIIPVTDEAFLDTPLDYESLAASGSGLGSASIIVVDETVDMDWLLGKTVHFFGHELCGKCTPCRVGNRILLNIIEKIDGGEGEPGDLQILQRAAETMDRASLCGLGQATANTVLSTTKYFLSR
jgi:NADH-quinone oxidoreductase subunit F